MDERRAAGRAGMMEHQDANEDGRPGREGTPLVGVLIKASNVLRALTESDAPLGPSEIAQRTGVDRSAVHRILTTLARDRLVERDGDGGAYRLGAGLAAMGLVAASRLDLRRIARPHLESLFAGFNETVNLGVLDGDAVLYVDMIESRHGLRMAARVGARDDLTTTSLGKAILAYLPEPTRRAMIARLPLQPRTPHSIRFPEQLQQALNRVRVDGFALDLEENEIGACCVGAPIQGWTGEVAGAVSVSVPSARFGEDRRREVIDGVVRAAQRISGEFALPAGPQPDARKPSTGGDGS